jgi:polar amino acid transport system substrate-binding protein
MRNKVSSLTLVVLFVGSVLLAACQPSTPTSLPTTATPVPTSTLQPSPGGEIVVYTAYQEDSPPRYFEENGQAKGLCVDIIEALNQELHDKHIRIESTGWYPVARMLLMLESNELQILVGFGSTPERQEKLFISQTPVFTQRMLFAKLATDPFEYTGIESVKGKTIGTLGGSQPSAMAHAIPGVTIEDVPKMEMNLKKLELERIDLVFYNQLGLTWEIKRAGLAGKIVLTKNIYKEDPNFVLFSKKISPTVMTEIENALSTLKNNGTLEKLLAPYIDE